MPKKNLIWVILVGCLALVTAWISQLSSKSRYGSPMRADALAEAYRIIANNYYHRASLPDLRRYAVEGMVRQLDEFTTYVPSEKADAFRQRMQGRWQGVGVRVEPGQGGEILVISVLSGSPAYKAGVKTGDRIVAINGKTPVWPELGRAADLLQAGDDGKVRLRVTRKQAETQSLKYSGLEFVIDPSEVSVVTVKGLYQRPNGDWAYMVDVEQGIAYIRVGEFVPSTVKEFERAFRQPHGVRGLVLDLRSNPGGMLDQAVALANLFLDSGTIVTVVDADGQQHEHAAHESGTYPAFPLVILTDGKTASGAEIVAGALANQDRAVLVGQETRGKFFVQSMFDLGKELGMLNLTTARLFIGKVGDHPESEKVKPHLSIPLVTDMKLLESLGQKPAEKGPQPTTRPSASQPDAQTRIRKILKNDPVLARAVALLNQPAQMRKILTQAKVKRLDKAAKAKSNNAPTR